eukprot:1395677-Pleurochrysis_carterae.AAC.1
MHPNSLTHTNGHAQTQTRTYTQEPAYTRGYTQALSHKQTQAPHSLHATTPRVSADLNELQSRLRLSLLDPVLDRRLRHLQHSPCPADEYVSMATLLGLDVSRHTPLLWLVDAAMAAEMPNGWVRCEPKELGSDAKPFYWNTLTRAAQCVCRARRPPGPLFRSSI